MWSIWAKKDPLNGSKSVFFLNFAALFTLKPRVDGDGKLIYKTHKACQKIV